MINFVESLLADGQRRVWLRRKEFTGTDLAAAKWLIDLWDLLIRLGAAECAPRRPWMRWRASRSSSGSGSAAVMVWAPVWISMVVAAAGATKFLIDQPV